MWCSFSSNTFQRTNSIHLFGYPVCENCAWAGPDKDLGGINWPDGETQYAIYFKAETRDKNDNKTNVHVTCTECKDMNDKFNSDTFDSVFITNPNPIPSTNTARSDIP